MNKKLADLERVKCCGTCDAKDCLLRCYGSSGSCNPNRCLPAIRSQCQGYKDADTPRQTHKIPGRQFIEGGDEKI